MCRHVHYPLSPYRLTVTGWDVFTTSLMTPYLAKYFDVKKRDGMAMPDMLAL